MNRPYYSEYYQNGYLKCEVHLNDNKQLHNSDNDKCSLAHYYQNGYTKYMLYYKDGKLHRENNKPAELYYYSNGQLHYKSFRLNGKLCCIDNGSKPSLITYYPSGNIKSEIYCTSNNIKNYKIKYNNNKSNTIICYTYYDQFGNKITDEDLTNLTKPCRD